MRELLQRLGREGGLALALGGLVLVMSIISPYFLTGDNLLGMSRHLAEVGIIACGMTLVIVSGGIDLSVGSLLGLCGIALGYGYQAWGLEAGLVAALTTGLVCGGLNGLLVSRWRLPPLIVTLATMALFRGAAMTISQAQPVSDFPEGFGWIGQGDLFGLPVQLYVWMAALGLTGMVMRRTRTGRQVRAIGDSERAARFAALPVERVVFWLYAACGLLCAVGGIVFTARVSTARADAGLGLELEVITAVVLGGTRITGGQGSVVGSFLGVLILGVVRNGFTLAGVSSVWQAMLAGAILIGTAVLNQRLAERR